MPKNFRIVVLGGKSVGKTAIIEQAVFGNHVAGRVRVIFELFVPLKGLEFAKLNFNDFLILHFG